MLRPRPRLPPVMTAMRAWVVVIVLSATIVLALSGRSPGDSDTLSVQSRQ